MSPRTCSHIKSNGSKCGSPALKYHTHCYFHYQWLNRRMNRYYYDLKEGWTTMTLPPLESKASILFAISEIQSSLLTGSIDAKVAKTLFYGIQLAIQLKATEEDLAAKDTPSTCFELDDQLRKDRARHNRPPQAVCNTCERADDCSSGSDCHYSTEQIRELERVHEPERYARQHADEKRNEEQWRQHEERLAKHAEEEARKRAAITAPAPHATTSNDSSLAQSPTGRTEGAAVSTTTTASNPDTTSSDAQALNPCHPGPSAAVSSAAEGPVVSPAPATPSTSSTTPASSTPTHPEHDARPAVSSTPALTSTNHDRKLFHSPAQFSRLENRALNEINILRSNS